MPSILILTIVWYMPHEHFMVSVVLQRILSQDGNYRIAQNFDGGKF